jgi:hypothetical protein
MRKIGKVKASVIGIIRLYTRISPAILFKQYTLFVIAERKK